VKDILVFNFLVLFISHVFNFIFKKITEKGFYPS
jgi:hypothetical protein